MRLPSPATSQEPRLLELSTKSHNIPRFREGLSHSGVFWLNLPEIGTLVCTLTGGLVSKVGHSQNILKSFAKFP